MIYGEGTSDFNKLSVSLPDDFKKVYNQGTAIQCFQNKEMFCCMSDSGSSHSGLINCGKNDESIIYTQSFLGKNNEPSTRKRRCLAKENHTRANRLCSVLGTKGSIGNTWTPSGHSNRYQRYILN